MSWGVKPDAMIGHSIGEYVAACIGGTFERDDALVLVARRARLMEGMPTGAMLGVRASADTVEAELTPNVSIAAINAPNHTVVSGDDDAIIAFESKLDAKGIANRRLHTSHAYHSPMMDPALEPYSKFVAEMPRRAPQLRWISSLTGRPITDEEAVDPDYWARQLREPVQFARGIGELIGSDFALIEVGPGQTLAALTRQHDRHTATQLVTTSLHPGQEWRVDADYMLTAAGQLWARGVDIDWIGFHRGARRRRVPLPTYPFRRQRHWVDAVPADDGMPAIVIPRPEAMPAMPVTVSPSALVVAAPSDRPALLLSRLRQVFTDLSGIDPATLTPDANFLEIGFDSLFLTQVSNALQKQYTTKITVRTLLEDASTLNLLVERILPTLPEDAFPAPKPTAPIAQPGTAPAEVGTLAGVAQQLAVIARQLEILGTPTDVPAPTTTVNPAPVAVTPPPTANSASMAPTTAFGPYRPPKRSTTGGLTDEQQRNLTGIIARYNAKTAKSKASTEENRAHLADPRTVSGFRQSWKEMVYPIVTVRSSGTHLTDVDGNDYVDITNGFGMIFFGHNPKFVRDAVDRQYDAGIEIGPQSPLAGEVSKLLCEMVGMERAAFCSTGSEAVMAAIRVARTVSGRDKIVMFTGAYHGIFDEVLVRPAMGGDGRAMPIAPGIPAAMTDNILVLEYGTPETLETIKSLDGELAAVLVETVQSRRPEFQPREFLRALRKVTEESDTALIFDEVVTGFRVHPGGAQALFGVRADIATYGKVVGGGLPIGIVAGRSKYLDALDGGTWRYGDDSGPEAGVTFFAGTFVRHPLALAAARAVLLRLKDEGPELQRGLNLRTTAFVERLRRIVAEVGAPVQINHFSSWFVVSFPPDLPLTTTYFTLMRERGVHTWEGRPCFLTLAHSDADLDHVAESFRVTLLEMQAADFLPSTVTEPGDEPVSADEPFALTEAQREMCAVTLMSDEANCSYNQCFVLELHGPLAVESMYDALTVVVERHEALRLSIDLASESQRVLSDVPVVLPVTDLSLMNDRAREDALTQLIHRETHTPFDLDATPLWHAEIVREAPDRHRLVFTVHHIVADGWSSAVIFGDLGKAYVANRLGMPAVLPEAASFREFAGDEQSPTTAAEMSAALAFWKAQYADSVPAFELPLDHPRPAFKTFGIGRQVLAIDKELCQAIRTCAARYGATHFVALLAAFEVLVARLASTEDLIIGVPTAGQALQENGHLVAHGVNTIPLRCRVDARRPFAEHLRTASTAFLDAQAHPRLTFGTLVQELRLPRDPSRTPLVSVIFNIDKLGSPFDFGDVSVAGVETPKAFDNFDFGINAIDNGESILLECDFNADLFDAATVAGWLRQYRRLLECVAAEPTVPLAELSVLTEDELAELVGVGQIPTFETRDATLHEAFARQVTTSPDAIAVSIDTPSGRDELTYAALDQRAEALAAHLRALGVGANHVVGLRVERSLEVVIGMLAILKAAGAYLPLDPVLPIDRIAFMLADTSTSVVLTQRSLVDELAALPITCISMDTPLPPAPATPAATTASGDDLAYVIYTSGSTGQPKGVPITHRKVLRLYAASDAGPSFGPTDVWTLLYSYAFDASVWDIWGALLFGGRLVIVPQDVSHDMVAFRTLLERERITVLDQTPTTFRALIDADRDAPPADFALRHVVLGGEALELQMLKPWFDRYGDTTPELFNTYGPTETTVQVTFRRITRADLGAGTGSVIGAPLADIRIYLLDAHGQPVPIGVTGEMYIAGGGVADGYLNRPELTEQRFVPDPFHGGLMYRSGDLARRLHDGDLEFLGRVDQQVKIRGFRIELGEVEAAIAEHPAVGQVAVIDREDTPGERKLVAYLVAGSPPPTLIADLRESLRKRLPDYMVPAHFVYVDALPLTSNGKLDRKALPAPEDGRTEPREIVDPRSSNEALVVELFNELLGRSDVSVFDNFFDLGGHSLMAARLMAKLRETARVDLPLRNLFERPTPEQLAMAIDALSWTAVADPSSASAGQGEREEIEL
jgi:amino acid adenylation domain-containing protein